MSEQNTPNRFELYQEDTARDTATLLLMDAIEDTTGFVPARLDELPGAAIFAAAHALIAKLDAMETSQLEVLRDLRESLDFLSASTNGNDAELTPTKHESELIYRTLEADYLAHNTPASIENLDAALCRFKKLAGIYV